MNYGDYVLELLRDVPASEKTIILLRHSHRDSFKGIPDSQREGVEITQEGVRMARAFGGSLGQIFPDKRILIGHTAALRCRMTAESIGHGYTSPDRVRILGCHPEVGSVVANQDKYIRLREEFGWHHLMKRWLNGGIAEDTLENPRTFCDRTVRGLVSFSGRHPEDLHVVIAHDVTIFPILSGFFGKTVLSLDFLNGIVITGDSTSCEIRFADADHMLKDVWNVSSNSPARENDEGRASEPAGKNVANRA